MFSNLVDPSFSIAQWQHLKIVRKPYWYSNDKKDEKDQ